MNTRLLFIALISFALLGSTCKRDVHLFIEVINNSDDDIIYARKFHSDYKCLLDGPTIKSKEKYEDYSGSWWNRRLKDGRTDTVYLINPQKYNDSVEFYDCDSIYIKNDVLKTVVITLEMMKNNDWKIIYE